jgi:16S rRNA (uracil1498-N3)-methyltransferase
LATRLAHLPVAHVMVADVDTPVLDEPDAHHLQSVLRLRKGEKVTVTDGLGGLRSCTWAGDGVLEPVSEVERHDRLIPLVTVAFAAVKGDRPEWAVQKLAELGVDRLVILQSDRSVVRWDGGRAVSHLERFSRVARSALMQSRGVWMPKIEMSEFRSLVASEPAPSDVSMAVPGGPGLPSLERPTVLVGPEGGWSPDEEESGLHKVSLGSSVLRTETAAVTAGVLLCSLRAGVVSSR